MGPARVHESLDDLPDRIDGVIIVRQGRRSVYLPEVWKQIPDPAEFLSRLCRKQGAPPDAWRSLQGQ